MFLFRRGPKDPLKNKWNHLSLEARRRWGLLTDEDIDQIDGDREVLIERVQQRYNIPPQNARQQVDEWVAKHNL